MRTIKLLVVACAMISICIPALLAQPAPSADVAAAPAPEANAAPEKPPLSAADLEQLLAPIALYPDSLLTQMLMASTYPLEIVEADRWVKANKNLQGDALAKELENQKWDASVKSLVNFPDQLSVMSEKLDTTMKIGDAFIDQQADVMNTIQVLRNKAQASGNLKGSSDLKVDTAPAPAPAANSSNSTVVNVQGSTATAPAQTTVVQAPPQVITIQSANPQVVYVPTYEPTQVYGAWPYPPPPPYYPPRPPGYVASNMISFGVGVACGAAWGYAWGHSDWGHNDVDIDVNRNATFNTNIDRSKYQANIDARKTNIQNNEGSWQHDPSHRQGVPYQNKQTAQKYGGANQAQAAKAREQFRGRTETGAQGAARNQQAGGAANLNARDGNRTGNAQANQLNAGGQNRDTLDRGGAQGTGQNRPGAAGGGTQDRSAAAGQNRPGAGGGGAQDRSASQDRAAAQDRGSSGLQGGAFDGANRSGSETRAASQRGQSSRSGSSSGASRGGGGGGARGGGGRR